MNEYSGYSIDTTLNTLTSLKVKVVSIMGIILRFQEIQFAIDQCQCIQGINLSKSQCLPIRKCNLL